MKYARLNNRVFLFDKSDELSETQSLMLQLSDEDIKAGKFILQEILDQADLGWLKDLTTF